MNHFLRAEWKTLLVVALAGVAVFLVFQREEEELARQAAPPAVSEHATVLPGERLGALELDPATLREHLGTPTRERRVEPGLEALHYEPHSVIVYRERASGRIAGVELTVETDPSAVAAALIAPDGQDLVAHWDRAERSLGPVLARMQLTGGGTLWRYDGLLVELAVENDKMVPRRLTLLPKMPRDLFAAYQPPR